MKNRSPDSQSSWYDLSRIREVMWQPRALRSRSRLKRTRGIPVGWPWDLPGASRTSAPHVCTAPTGPLCLTRRQQGAVSVTHTGFRCWLPSEWGRAQNSSAAVGPFKEAGLPSERAPAPLECRPASGPEVQTQQLRAPQKICDKGLVGMSVPLGQSGCGSSVPAHGLGD